MSEEKTEVAATIDAVSKLAQNVPIYQDLLQPAAREVGKNLETASKLVTVALSPVRGLVWGYEKIENYLTETLSKKLEGVPENRISPPPAKIAGPVFESLRFCAEESQIRNMFANLLANSMDSETADFAHPAFVEIIKNLSGDEAKILNYFSENNITSLPVIDQAARFSSNNGQTVIYRNVTLLGELSGCNRPDLISSYIDNLIRLGIFLRGEGKLLKPGVYSELEKSSVYLFNMGKVNEMNNHLDEDVTYHAINLSVQLTDFGKKLIDVGIRDKSIENA